MPETSPISSEDPIFGDGDAPVDGIGLCLSGGGYRAMLFHVGALWRLIEGGKLFEVTRVSSVSGGSITAGVLALAWNELKHGGMAAFQARVVAPLRGLAGVTIDERSIVSGLILPGTIGDYIAKAYASHLFHEATLQSLPEEPRFIFNATNLETGNLFRFSRRYARDWRVGSITAPEIPLAHVVAASSAFPPVLSPYILDVSPDDFDPPAAGEIANPAFREEISLTDGGVYDNLGLEQVWKRCRTVLVSDGGGHMADDPSPPGDWARQAKRVLDIVDNQVRNLRKRQVIDSYKAGHRQGVYWGIRTNIADYHASGALDLAHAATVLLAEIPTRLKRMTADQQKRLINWGYAVCDAALRSHWPDTLAAPGLPYPDAGIA